MSRHRDVRTLLLCKIHRGHSAAYTTICEKGQNSRFPFDQAERANYFTVGGFDALITYKLLSFDENLEPDWMSRLAKDKKASLGGMTEDLSYHPIHIVANESVADETQKKRIEAFWDEKTIRDYPFLLLTFVYGARHDKTANNTYEDEMWDYLKGTVTDIRCPFVVYNSVNLCDLVVLMRTRDISYALEQTLSIGRTGHARKTYTVVNIPMDNGGFSETIKSVLREEQGSYQAASRTNDNVGNLLHICIRGSICDSKLFHEEMKALVNNENAILPACDCKKLNLGESDFMIATAVSGETFLRLLQHFLEQSDSIDRACWFIYTELQFPYPDSSPQDEQSPPPLNVLSKEYNRYLKIYPHLHKKGYSWADAFLELSNIHAHIDRLPVLHGPSYLIWGCLHVANQYFSRKALGCSSEEELDAILKNSQNNLERFVLDWSQLTDQITKVDDVILHRLGNTTAIYNTLSESLLELYHLFLSCFSKSLICSDGIEGITPHSFLLAPTLSQKMRFFRVFSISPEIPSEQQVYIIEFPVDYLYSPGPFVFQLAHECLHSFGRSIRMRKNRLKPMLGFLAFTIVDSFAELNQPQKMARVIANKLNTSLDALDAGRTVPADGDRFDRRGLYMDQTIENLKRIIPEKILTQQTYREMCMAAGPESRAIFSDRSIRQWVKLSECFVLPRREYRSPDAISLSDVIDACKYFFRECYADVMAIRLLGFTLDDYLGAYALTDSLPEIPYTPEDGQFVQRLAIVLAATMREHVLTVDPEPGADASAPYPFATEQLIRERLNLCFNAKNPNLSSRLYDCFDVLYHRENTSSGRWPPQGSRAYFSVNALGAVVDYLSDALRNVSGLDSIFSDVRELYRTVIKGGDFFCVDYYNYIAQYHDSIAKEI